MQARGAAARAAGALLLVLLALAAPCGALLRKSPEAALLDWLKAKGGELHATVDAPKGRVRGTYVTKDVKANDVLARIPLKCGIWFPHDYAEFSELGVIVAREALKPDSNHAPYLAALPMATDPSHTISYETFPVEYLPLMASPLMANHITTTQTATHNYWASKGAKLLEEGITLDRLRAALVTVATRYFGISHKGVSTSIMIPLLDLANHYENCTNYYEYLPCKFDDKQGHDKASSQWSADSVERDDLCVFWRAGHDVKAGQELCNRYGYMAPDQAFFQYSFILPDEPPAISRVDESTFTSEYIYGALAHQEPVEFDGHIEAVKDEMKRISHRIEELKGLAKAEAVTAVAPTDKGGRILAGLKALRRQRITALENEHARLAGRVREEEAHKAGAGGSSGGSAGGGGGDVEQGKTEL